MGTPSRNQPDKFKQAAREYGCDEDRSFRDEQPRRRRARGRPMKCPGSPGG